MTTRKLLWGMTWRGILWGLISGAFLGGSLGALLPIMISRGNTSPDQAILGVGVIAGLIVGSIIGLVIGLIIGTLGGLLMGITTRLFYFPIGEKKLNRMMLVTIGFIFGAIGFTFIYPAFTARAGLSRPDTNFRLFVSLFTSIPAILSGLSTIGGGLYIARWYENEMQKDND